MNFHVVKPLMFIYTSWFSGAIHVILKEFQSLENDVCHSLVFGNVATNVASCKMLHWMQKSNVF